MDCRQVRGKLSGLVDGDAPPVERGIIEAHVTQCEPCAEELAALQQFLGICDEQLVCPGRPYTFAMLKARMRTVEPLEELAVFVPKLRVRGTLPRYAVTCLLLMLVLGSQYTLKGTRQMYTAMRSPFAERSTQVAAAAEGVLPEDVEYDAMRTEIAREREPLV